jgi:hypothetical protein
MCKPQKAGDLRAGVLRRKDSTATDELGRPRLAEPQRFNRTIPLILLLAAIGVLALHHWYVVTEGSAFVVALFILPPFGMLALGGVIYPPVLWSIGKYGKGLPATVKMVGVLLAVSGLAIGFYLFKFVYRF